MFKKFLAVFFAALMVVLVGCGDKEIYNDAVSSNVPSSTETTENNEENTVSNKENLNGQVNPLTGLAEFEDETKSLQRPLAIMVENTTLAMPGQTGLSKADIIYETEVEGGITRLMAVYQDVSDVEKIGNVRSARYAYIDLALGHNAIYVHCGSDPQYARPHLDDIDDIDLGGNYNSKSADGGQRFELGLSTEHELYAWAGDLWTSISEKFTITQEKSSLWADFTDEKITLDDGNATSVSVPFPASTTKFEYDAESGLYTRYTGTKAHTDYFTGDKTQVKNVFVLLTPMTHYETKVHRKISLEGGKGYYITNGTVQEIKWTKGAWTSGFVFTDLSGEEIQVSAGNSWVCIADSSSCKPEIK